MARPKRQLNEEVQEIENELDQETEAVTQEESDFSESPELSPIEKEAYLEGWRTKEEFQGDPSQWVSAHEFLRYGKLQKKLEEDKRHHQRELEEMRASVARMSQAKELEVESRIQQIKAERDHAASEADMDKYYAKEKALETIQKERDLYKSSTPVRAENVIEKDPVIVDWETRNPWINDPEDKRAQMAQGAWYSFNQKNPHASNAEKLAYVDKQVNTLMESSRYNPLREATSMTENNRNQRRFNTNKSKSLTMNDLTDKERAMWEIGPARKAVWKNNESDFLKDMQMLRQQREGDR